MNVRSGSSTNVWLTNLIQRYEARPAKYENEYLAYFIANYVERYIVAEEANEETELLVDDDDDGVVEEDTAASQNLPSATIEKEVIWRERAQEIIIK